MGLGTQQRIQQQWKNQNLLIILVGYTVFVLVLLYFTVEISLTKQGLLRDDFEYVKGTVTSRTLLKEPKERGTNETFIFTSNNTVHAADGHNVAGVHGLIPSINCSDDGSLTVFENHQSHMLTDLTRNQDFIALLVVSSSDNNESIADYFIGNLCKPGTSFSPEHRRTVVEFIDNILLAAAVGPSQAPDIMKYYRSVINQRVFNLHCPTCALVSSSGRILGSNAGRDIDKHSCVVRMNNAPTLGFEKDVGSRTTVRVSSFVSVMAMERNNHSFIFGPERGVYNLYWGLDKKQHAKWMKTLTDTVKRNGTHTEVYYQQVEGEIFLNQHFYEMTGQDIVKSKSWLSTGWFTFELLLDMCDKLDVYGMVPEDYCRNHHQKIKYHYFQEKPSPTECGTYKFVETAKKFAHRFMTEKAVFAKWGAQYNVSFYHPYWNISHEAAKTLNTPFIMNQKMKKKSPVHGKVIRGGRKN